MRPGSRDEVSFPGAFSSLRLFNNPQHTKISTTENGSPAATEAVCSAESGSPPAAAPAISKIAATAPSVTAQNSTLR